MPATPPAPTTTTTRPPRTGTGSGVGPPLLLLLAVIFAVLFLASVVGVDVVTRGAHLPSPFDPVGKLSQYLAAHHSSLQVTALLQFASAIPLAILTAAVVARIHHLGIRAPGATITLVGGVLASAMLLISAGCAWVLAQPGIRPNVGVARALQNLAFATGGPGHVVPLGLLIAGIAVIAVFARWMLPRALAFAGIAIAVIAELSTLSLVIHDTAILLPIARFAGIAWLIAAAKLLPHSRPTRTPATTPSQAHGPILTTSAA